VQVLHPRTHKPRRVRKRRRLQLRRRYQTEENWREWTGFAGGDATYEPRKLFAAAMGRTSYKPEAFSRERR